MEEISKFLEESFTATYNSHEEWLKNFAESITNIINIADRQDLALEELANGLASCLAYYGGLAFTNTLALKAKSPPERADEIAAKLKKLVFLDYPRLEEDWQDLIKSGNKLPAKASERFMELCPKSNQPQPIAFVGVFEEIYRMLSEDKLDVLTYALLQQLIFHEIQKLPPQYIIPDEDNLEASQKECIKGIIGMIMEDAEEVEAAADMFVKAAQDVVSAEIEEGGTVFQLEELCNKVINQVTAETLGEEAEENILEHLLKDGIPVQITIFKFVIKNLVCHNFYSKCYEDSVEAKLTYGVADKKLLQGLLEKALEYCDAQDLAADEVMNMIEGITARKAFANGHEVSVGAARKIA